MSARTVMWTVLDKAGTSDTDDRIALMRRYLALFGAASIKLLLADSEFIGMCSGADMARNGCS